MSHIGRNWVDRLKQKCTSLVSPTLNALWSSTPCVLSRRWLYAWKHSLISASSIYTRQCYIAANLLQYSLCYSFMEVTGPLLVVVDICYVAGTHCWSHWWTDRKHSHHLCCHALAPIVVAIEELGSWVVPVLVVAIKGVARLFTINRPLSIVT